MTPKIKKILYATDLSANSAYALGFALKSASLYHAEMVILHVFDRPTIGYAPMLDVYIDDKNRQALFNEHAADVKARVRKRLEMIYAKELVENPEYGDTTNFYRDLRRISCRDHPDHGRRFKLRHDHYGNAR